MKLKFAASLAIAVIVLFTAAITACGEEITDGIINYRLNKCGAADVQEWIDGELTENAGKSSEWYVFALSRTGEYDFTSYRNALEAYVEENDVKSPVSRQKYALVLKAVGSDSSFIAETAENTIGQQGIMSYVYGLHLLNNGCTSSAYAAEDVTAEILALQLKDGGWAITGEYGDVDVTAMTLQSLAPYYSEESIKTAVDKALDFLSERQLEDGDFSSYGVPCGESTAQVIAALSALKINLAEDSRFIKNGSTILNGLEKYKLSDGSFTHKEGGTADGNATVQAFYAMAACNCDGNFFIIKKSEETTPVRTESVNTEETAAVKSDTEETAEKSGSYKPAVCIIITAVGAVCCVALLILKKNKKNCIAVAVIAAAGIIFVLATNFQSADEFYSGEDTVKQNPIGTVTMSIRCDTVAGRAEHISEDGIVLDETAFEIEAGETVYDILTQAAKRYEIHVENSGGDGLVYISGINYIYEFDYGGLSGWMVFVNGEESSVGCDALVLSDGDRIEWIYSCEMGKDIK